jgi:hypothetical protein
MRKRGRTTSPFSFYDPFLFYIPFFRAIRALHRKRSLLNSKTDVDGNGRRPNDRKVSLIRKDKALFQYFCIVLPIYRTFFFLYPYHQTVINCYLLSSGATEK